MKSRGYGSRGGPPFPYTGSMTGTRPPSSGSVSAEFIFCPLGCRRIILAVLPHNQGRGAVSVSCQLSADISGAVPDAGNPEPQGSACVEQTQTGGGRLRCRNFIAWNPWRVPPLFPNMRSIVLTWKNFSDTAGHAEIMSAAGPARPLNLTRCRFGGNSARFGFCTHCDCSAGGGLTSMLRGMREEKQRLMGMLLRLERETPHSLALSAGGATSAAVTVPGPAECRAAGRTKCGIPLTLWEATCPKPWSGILEDPFFGFKTARRRIT